MTGVCDAMAVIARTVIVKMTLVTLKCVYPVKGFPNVGNAVSSRV